MILLMIGFAFVKYSYHYKIFEQSSTLQAIIVAQSQVTTNLCAAPRIHEAIHLSFEWRWSFDSSNLVILLGGKHLARRTLLGSSHVNMELIKREWGRAQCTCLVMRKRTSVSGWCEVGTQFSLIVSQTGKKKCMLLFSVDKSLNWGYCSTEINGIGTSDTCIQPLDPQSNIILKCRPICFFSGHGGCGHGLTPLLP